jgi:hypothetical protein
MNVQCPTFFVMARWFYKSFCSIENVDISPVKARHLTFIFACIIIPVFCMMLLLLKSHKLKICILCHVEHRQCYEQNWENCSNISSLIRWPRT